MLFIFRQSLSSSTDVNDKLVLQVENIQGFVHLIYFRLIYIKIDISIWLLQNKKIYFIKKQPLMKVIHQLKEVSRTVISSLKLSLKVNLCLLMVRFTLINIKLFIYEI